MALNRLNILIDRIPYSFNITLTNFGIPKTYTISVLYNDIKDFYTVSISDVDGEIINGEKIVYGNPLFARARRTRLPDEVFIPYDPNGINTVVNSDTLNKSVFIYVFSPEVFLNG